MNTFKQKLRLNQPQIGLWLSLAEPTSAEVCAASAFDWLLIDCEHAPNDIPVVLRQLQAIAGYPIAPVVRAVSDDANGIKQLLDLGVTNLLVPMISTEQQARDLVAAVLYPPAGRRGIGHALARASRWGRDPGYFEGWSDQACILVQLESAEALANLEAIVGVKGIDGVLMGPADLAASLGHPGDVTHPDVLAAIDDAITRTRALGRAAGVITVGADPATRYFDKGCTFVAAGVDVLLLARAADELAAAVKVRLGVTSPDPEPSSEARSS